MAKRTKPTAIESVAEDSNVCAHRAICGDSVNYGHYYTPKGYLNCAYVGKPQTLLPGGLFKIHRNTNRAFRQSTYKRGTVDSQM